MKRVSSKIDLLQGDEIIFIKDNKYTTYIATDGNIYIVDEFNERQCVSEKFITGCFNEVVIKFGR